MALTPYRMTALLLCTLLALSACAGSPSAAQTSTNVGQQTTPSAELDEPLDLVVDPSVDAEDNGETDAKPDSESGDKAESGEGSSGDSQTRSQVGAQSPIQGAEYTWQDGDRTFTAVLQADLIVQKDPPADSLKDAVANTGDGVIVAKSGAQGGQPVFKSQSGELMTLPGGVLLVLEPKWTETQVSAFLGENGIKRDQVSELGFASNGFFVETDPGFPSLDLANKLASQEGVIISSPNWWTEVSTR